MSRPFASPPFAPATTPFTRAFCLRPMPQPLGNFSLPPRRSPQTLASPPFSSSPPASPAIPATPHKFALDSRRFSLAPRRTICAHFLPPLPAHSNNSAARQVSVFLDDFYSELFGLARARIRSRSNRRPGPITRAARPPASSAPLPAARLAPSDRACSSPDRASPPLPRNSAARAANGSPFFRTRPQTSRIACSVPPAPPSNA